MSTDPNFWWERRAEADSNRGPSAYQPNALPLGQTGSPRRKRKRRALIGLVAPFRAPSINFRAGKRCWECGRSWQPSLEEGRRNWASVWSLAPFVTHWKEPEPREHCCRGQGGSCQHTSTEATRLLGTGSPGRPSLLSHSLWALKHWHLLLHLYFHTASELWNIDIFFFISTFTQPLSSETLTSSSSSLLSHSLWALKHWHLLHLYFHTASELWNIDIFFISTFTQPLSSETLTSSSSSLLSHSLWALKHWHFLHLYFHTASEPWNIDIFFISTFTQPLSSETLTSSSSSLLSHSLWALKHWHLLLHLYFHTASELWNIDIFFIFL